ncbi:GNAT family N-acetyltransferase [Streptomyces sp. NPDC059740]|uniref:GNAT family N-acetyltransferase n=1 Tax=Streptomyces sp. NPDC059740 TaxID=3346926 RepID=UPI003653040C
MTSGPFVRPYATTDRADLADICVRTGHEGGDSRSLHPDLDLLPAIFALPYVEREPQLAFVVEADGRAVGYVIGTADTQAFVRWYRTTWLPTLAERWPAPTSAPATAGEEMVHLMHTPERLLLPELAAHPAHLHIDLLPGFQRRGLGRALMRRFLAALAEQGVPAVHLGMVTANTAARAFYDRTGFQPLAVPDPGPLTYLGRPTTGEV